MDASQHVNSFSHFYEKILPKAFYSPDFSDENIANAFLWAEFCEKLCNQLNEDSAKELKEYFQAEKFTKYGNFRQCTSILCHAFLQNPYIDRNHLEDILLKTKLPGLNLCEIWTDAVELESLSVRLLESLKSVSLTDADQSFYYTVKSELFLDFIKDYAEQLPTEEQLEGNLSFVFETLTKSHDGMMVLLYALLCNTHKDYDIQDFAIHWILSKFLENRNCPLAIFFWKQSPCKLRNIATKHPAFYSYYIDYLTYCASLFEHMSENNTKQLEKRPSTNEEYLSYDELVKHFKTLQAGDDAVSQSTHDYLGTKTNEEKSSIWKNILFSS